MESMKKRKIKLGALALASMLLVTPLGGCKKDTKENDIKSIIYDEELYKVFKPGEHIVSVKVVEDLRDKIYQHQYYEGYKVIGIAAFTHGQVGDIYGGSIITYINTEDVKCMLTRKDEKRLKYENFGIPIIQKNDRNESINILNEGEHILTVPFKMESNKDLPELEYHEGYECVGIEFNTYGKIGSLVDGGFALYVNTVPVECKEIKTAGNEINYTFGTPVIVQETKKLTLK